LRVLNDNRITPAKEDTISDGFAISVQYKNQWRNTAERFKWDPWAQITDITDMEHLKKSYFVMKDNLHSFNTPAVAVNDSFYFSNSISPLSIGTFEGLLKNDFDLDGDLMVSLITENPRNGQVYLNNDGSFDYFPNEKFVGYDSFKYCVYDGYTLSKPNSVVVYVDTNSTSNEITLSNFIGLSLYPNPASHFLNVKSQQNIELLQVFDVTGKLIDSHSVNSKELTLDVSIYQSGIYVVVAKTANTILSERFIK